MNKALITCALMFSLIGCKRTDWENQGSISAPYRATNVRQKSGQNIRFSHPQHDSIQACNSCHREKVATLELDQSLGHGLCLDCHRSQKRGPTECAGCHTPE